MDLPVFLRDTKQLLLKLGDLEWKRDHIWISGDVSNLYSSIPHTLGLQAISYFLGRSGRFSFALQELILSSEPPWGPSSHCPWPIYKWDGGKYSAFLDLIVPRRSDTVFYCRYTDDLLFLFLDNILALIHGCSI